MGTLICSGGSIRGWRLLWFHGRTQATHSLSSACTLMEGIASGCGKSPLLQKKRPGHEFTAEFLEYCWIDGDPYTLGVAGSTLAGSRVARVLVSEDLEVELKALGDIVQFERLVCRRGRLLNELRVKGRFLSISLNIANNNVLRRKPQLPARPFTHQKNAPRPCPIGAPRRFPDLLDGARIALRSCRQTM